MKLGFFSKSTPPELQSQQAAGSQNGLSSELFKRGVDASNDVIFITNPKGEFVYINQVFTTIYGYTFEEVAGKTPRILKSGIKDLKFYEGFWGLITQKRSFKGVMINKTKEGKTVLMESTASPLLDEQEGIIGFMAIQRDITEQEARKEEFQLAIERLQSTQDAMINLLEDSRQLQRELKTQKEKVEELVQERTQELAKERAQLNASLDALPLGYFMFDTQHKLVRHNSALVKLLNLSKQTISTEVILGVFAPQNLDVGHFCSHCKTDVDETQVREVEVGTKIVKFFSVPVRLESELIGNVVLVEDITEARRLDQTKDEFFSVASHELRTPLTAIRGNASLIQQLYADKLPDEEIKAMIQDIHTSAVRLIALVNEFLDTSRLEQDKLVLNPVAVDAPQLIADVVTELQTVALEKKITLKQASKKLPKATAQVMVDRDKARQVLLNLVGNALKYTQEGTVSISAVPVHAEGSQPLLEVSITDTGVGIPADKIDLLFRKFQQANQKVLTRDTERSTGLGLYISKLLAQKMGGDVRLVVTEAGKGSTFAVTFPIATDSSVSGRSVSK